MNTPVIDRRHIMEYLVHGTIAAVLYLVPVFFLLTQSRYQNLYLLFIGNALFMAVIFYYAFYLVNHPYDSKRAVSMLIAGLLTTAVGILIAAVAVVVLTFAFFPDLFSHQVTDNALAQANTGVNAKYPSGFLFMMLIDVFLGNAAVGAFASIITSYANKRNQTKDQPADIENKIPVKTHS